jgi:hypothetical protein
VSLLANSIEFVWLDALCWEQSTVVGGFVIDYVKLAEHAKAKQEADILEVERHKELRNNRCAFFEQVKAHLIEEMNKANIELRKRKAAVFDQYQLPGFADEVFITYGTDSLCRVGLGILGGGCRITAIISGPPNGYEISRKEYICNEQPVDCKEVLPTIEDRSPAIPSCPDAIAADVIEGILIGKFA